MRVVTQTNITAFPLLSRGKVRDIYDIDDKTLLIVTTDRMSAFDVIMSEPVPYKGAILNQITLFWMNRFRDIIPNHLVESDVNKFPEALAPWKDELEGRSVLVRKAKPLPVECIVRGYITGSGWKDYQATGKVCGYELPANLQESAKREPAIFTPSTKQRIDELEARKEEILVNIQTAELQNPKLTREQMTAWFEQFRHGDPANRDFQKRLIDTFVNAVYVFDDKLVLTYNYQHGTQTISLDEIASALSSDFDGATPP